MPEAGVVVAGERRLFVIASRTHSIDLDPATGAIWSDAGPALDIEVSPNGAIVHGNRLFVVGGVRHEPDYTPGKCRGQHRAVTSNRVFVARIRDDGTIGAWARAADMPEGRIVDRLFDDGNRLYAIRGRTFGGYMVDKLPVPIETTVAISWDALVGSIVEPAPQTTPNVLPWTIDVPNGWFGGGTHRLEDKGRDEQFDRPQQATKPSPTHNYVDSNWYVVARKGDRSALRIHWSVNAPKSGTLALSLEAEIEERAKAPRSYIETTATTRQHFGSIEHELVAKRDDERLHARILGRINLDRAIEIVSATCYGNVAIAACDRALAGLGFRNSEHLVTQLLGPFQVPSVSHELEGRDREPAPHLIIVTIGLLVGVLLTTALLIRRRRMTSAGSPK